MRCYMHFSKIVVFVLLVFCLLPIVESGETTWLYARNCEPDNCTEPWNYDTLKFSVGSCEYVAGYQWRVCGNQIQYEYSSVSSYGGYGCSMNYGDLMRILDLRLLTQRNNIPGMTNVPPSGISAIKITSGACYFEKVCVTYYHEVLNIECNWGAPFPENYEVEIPRSNFLPCGDICCIREYRIADDGQTEVKVEYIGQRTPAGKCGLQSQYPEECFIICE